MQICVRETALQFGFRNEPLGTHTSRTMMLREITALFAATDPQTSHEAMRQLVIEENVALKDTLSTRKETFRRLSELYGLRPNLILSPYAGEHFASRSGRRAVNDPVSIDSGLNSQAA